MHFILKTTPVPSPQITHNLFSITPALPIGYTPRLRGYHSHRNTSNPSTGIYKIFVHLPSVHLPFSYNNSGRFYTAVFYPQIFGNYSPAGISDTASDMPRLKQPRSQKYRAGL
jgi:hypothetical protein